MIEDQKDCDLWWNMDNNDQRYKIKEPNQSVLDT